MSESIALPEVRSPCGVSPRLRLVAYAIVVAVVGSWACFTRLADGMLVVDEAVFAYTTEHMLATGDYIVPSIGRPDPHLNATPLYNWLCCLTANWADDNVRYRGWSAVFGVGCGLAALLLGAVLFGPEVGLLAGLLLVVNHHFVFVHGAREGVMDAALAFFLTVAVVCYAKTRESAGAGAGWWVGVGLCIGLAALTKPPVMAGSFATLLTLHHLLSRHDLPLRSRVTGPLCGAAVAAGVTLPWYAALCWRLGPECLDTLLFHNSVRRAASFNGQGRPSPQPWWFYCKLVWDSGWGYRAAGAALVWGCASFVSGQRRFPWGLLLLVVGGFGIAISAAATRNVQYAYPVFPATAVAIAALLLTGFSSPAGRGCATRWAWWAAGVCGVGFGVLAVRHDAGVVAQAHRAKKWEYAPFLVHQANESELAAGRVRLVLYGFPQPSSPLNAPRGFSFSDRGYVPYRLPHAAWVNSPEQLDRLLADETPTLVFLPPKMSPAEFAAVAPSHRADACLWMASGPVPYPALAFRGAEAALRLHAVFGNALRSASGSVR